jgi:hypothetical protein
LHKPVAGLHLVPLVFWQLTIELFPEPTELHVSDVVRSAEHVVAFGVQTRQAPVAGLHLVPKEF